MPRAAFLLLVLLFAPACRAQTTVHHCVSSDGSPVFTDQPCNSATSMGVGAVPATTSGGSCPTSTAGLRTRVAGAFLHHDVNALAGLMLWQDDSETQAVRQLAQLQHLVRRPLVALAATGAGPPTPAAATSASPPNPGSGATPVPPAQLQVRVGGAGASGMAPLHFAIQARAGCLWLDP